MLDEKNSKRDLEKGYFDSEQLLSNALTTTQKP